MPKQLLARLTTICGSPKTDSIEAFYAEYAGLLGKFGAETLKKAGDTLVANADGKWPSPKKCVEACIEAQSTIAGSAAAARASKPAIEKMPWEVRAEAAQQWAEDYCNRTDLGQQAREEGWRDQLRAYASSYARNYPGNGLPPFDWRPLQEVIADYRRPYLLRTEPPQERVVPTKPAPPRRKSTEPVEIDWDGVSRDSWEARHGSKPN